VPPNRLPAPRPAIDRMAGYVPGEQPGPGEKVIKLNTNENPYPPSPRVMEAIRGLDPEWLRRYPNPNADAFRETAARVHGVSRDMILAGNGSDEILAIVVRTFVGQGEVVTWPDPTYSLYPVLAEIGEARAVPVAWEAGWRLPAEALLATRPRAIFFANPNAPSGTVVPAGEVRALAGRTEAIVLVDEAYVDFADGDCLPLLSECPNVVVTRTLSKGYALAGLRFGYALAAAPLVAQMMKVKDSYNCDALATTAAEAALRDRDYARAGWEKVRAERTRLAVELERLGWRVIPSQANFLLAAVPGGDAGAIYRDLKRQGILVRFFDKPGLAHMLRISIGRREENDALLQALRAS
jgi:histidinol-phosphate aminotransferase